MWESGRAASQYINKLVMIGVELTKPVAVFSPSSCDLFSILQFPY
jgi:hypothetical protein